MKPAPEASAEPEQQILTDTQAAVLNGARVILANLQADLRDAAHREDEPADAYYAGRTSERAEVAEHEIFQVLNCLNAYGLRKFTYEQLHKP